MKILVVQDHLRNGGTERQSVLLANAFAAAGHETTLLTFRPGGALAPTVAAGVRHHALQSFDTRLDWFVPGLIGAVERFQADIYLLMGRMANCYGQTLAREVRDRWPRTRVIATMRTGKKLPWLFRHSLRCVHHIVANSHEARDTLVTAYVTPAEKISVIHNALVFPAESTLARNDALRAQHGATPATNVLLCVAMFRREKNQRELIEIAAGLPANADWQLWLAGDGPARQACEKLAAQKNLCARVRFLGFQPNPSALYDAADVAVHASWSESLSNFLIEAQAHGLPVVACQAQGIRESFIPDRTGWLIAPDDRASFRTALNRLFSDAPATRAARAAEARTYARTTFDPARQISAYLDLFSRLH